MGSSVVALEPSDWAHVAHALARHQAQLRRDGMHLPPAVHDLLEVALDSASGRQEPTSGDALAALLDAHEGGVLLATTTRAARLLDVSPRHVERLVASGALPSVQVGDSRRIRVVDIHSYVDGLADAGGTSREVV